MAMIGPKSFALCGFIMLLLASAAPPAIEAQSVLDRTPNLHNGWIGSTTQFNFNHRMRRTEFGGDTRLVAAPTFLLGVPVEGEVLLATQYASSSRVAEPNEWEVFARWSALEAGGRLPVGVAVTGAYNAAAESADGELSVDLPVANLDLVGTVRAFSHAYESSDFRVAIGAGVVARVGSSVALAGDVVSLTDQEAGERAVWGGAIQLRIPNSPHTISLQAANAASTTLEGSSRGGDDVLWGFEFTVPLTFLGSQ